jgi:hypothetical protein
MQGLPQTNIQNQLYAQIEGIKSIPMRVVSNWPTIVSFGGVDYVVNQIISLVPMVDGVAGSFVIGLLRGLRDTVKFVTWNAVGDRAV